MFDGIPFIITTEHSITMPDGRVFPINMRVSVDEQEQHPETQDSFALIEEVNPLGDTQFNVEGYIRTIPMFPISDLIKEQYCYLQSFGWAFTGSNYFTRRKNASSYLILYTYEGEGELEYLGSTWHLKPGEGFFIDCRLPHFYRTCGSSWQHLDLHLNGRMAEPVYQEYIREGTPLFREAVSGKLQMCLEQIAAMHARAVPYRDFQVAGILYEIIVHLLTLHSRASAGESGVTSNIQYLIRYIDNHYAEKLTLDYLAHFSGISKYYLIREFRKYTGFPPNEYIIRLRISTAQFLLQNTNESVQRIAESVGIPNAQHFTKQFRRITGVSPRDYRRK